MKSLPTGWGLFACAMLALSSAHAQEPPRSDATESASARFNRGVQLYKEGDARAALIEFRRAYEISPNWRVLYNIGQANQALQDYSAALSAFEKYLAQGGKEIDAKRRAAVENEVQKLQARVSRVTITCPVAGAEISVDDVVIGTTPLSEVVLVGAGRRKFTASKPGSVPVTRVIDVAGGEKVDLKLELTEAAATPVLSATPVVTTAPTPAPVPTQTQQPEERSSAPIWIGAAVTGALLAGTVVTGVLALGAHDDYQSQLDKFPGDAKGIDDARDKTKRMALVTDILGGATAVAGGITLYFVLRPSKPSTQTALQLRAGPSSVWIGGRF